MTETKMLTVKTKTSTLKTRIKTKTPRKLSEDCLKATQCLKT